MVGLMVRIGSLKHILPLEAKAAGSPLLDEGLICQEALAIRR